MILPSGLYPVSSNYKIRNVTIELYGLWVTTCGVEAYSQLINHWVVAKVAYVESFLVLFDVYAMWSTAPWIAQWHHSTVNLGDTGMNPLGSISLIKIMSKPYRRVSTNMKLRWCQGILSITFNHHLLQKLYLQSTIIVKLIFIFLLLPCVMISRFIW